MTTSRWKSSKTEIGMYGLSLPVLRVFHPRRRHPQRVCGPQPTPACFHAVHEQSMVFMLRWLRKSKEKYFMMYNIYVKFKFQCPWVEFSGTQLCSLVYILSLVTFILCQPSWVVVTETQWPTKLKIFTVCTFTKNICQPRAMSWH